MEIFSKPSKYYSPLRYPGGKASLSKYLAKLIEHNELNNCTYIEPFAGGAGAALNLLFNEYVDRVNINDLDKSIYAFWYSVVFLTDSFIEKVENVKITIAEWKKQKKVFTSESDSLLDLGFATFFLNRTNRSGILTGGPIGGIDQKGKWKIDARFNRKKLIERIHRIGLYRNRIDLTNLDGLDLLTNLKMRNDLFIYIDPPYVNKASDLYLNHFTQKDHEALAKCLHGEIKFKWVLSYDNDLIVKKLYQGKKYREFNINYSADKIRKGKEIIFYSNNMVIV